MYRFLPAALAAYMATSAWRSSSEPATVSRPTEARPRLRLGRSMVPSIHIGTFSDATMRSATASGSGDAVSSTTNSSPPRRATVSSGRTHERSLRATSVSISSPGMVTEDVVDLFEVVQIQQQDIHRDGPVAAECFGRAGR